MTFQMIDLNGTNTVERNTTKLYSETHVHFSMQISSYERENMVVEATGINDRSAKGPYYLLLPLPIKQSEGHCSSVGKGKNTQ